ncbi:MAG: hypothetical protein NXH75_17195 [Halobacteriovoraceae bacterium]|nr:hypothetical protein [Halobacteriovoraceae bacterium]
MIKLILGLCLLTFHNINADELAACRKEISLFGISPVSKDCKELLMATAMGNTSRVDDFKKGSAYVVENALFYQTDKINVFAGEYAAVKDPVAVVSDSNSGELAYLNKAGDIMTYSTRFFGNISPARKLVNKALFGATDLCLSESNIFALITEENKIVLFDRMANTNASKGHRRDQLLSEFNYGEHTFVSMGCSSSGDQIYLLDNNSDLYLYEPGKKGVRKIKSDTNWFSLSVPKN